MGTYSSTPQSTYAARVLRPLGRLVRDGHYGSPVLDAALAWLDLLDRNARVPVLTAHALLDLIVSITRDETLGVRAALQALSRPQRVQRDGTSVRDSLEYASQRVHTMSDGTRCKSMMVDDARRSQRR